MPFGLFFSLATDGRKSGRSKRDKNKNTHWQRFPFRLLDVMKEVQTRSLRLGWIKLERGKKILVYNLSRVYRSGGNSATVGGVSTHFATTVTNDTR